jgi:putative flippase GtrA
MPEPNKLRIYNIDNIIKYLDFGQVIRYILAGATCAFIEFIIFSALVLYANVHYLTANVLAASIATFAGFWLQKHITFRNSETNYLVQIAKFFTVIGIGFLLNNLLVYLFIGIFKLHIFIGKPVELFLIFFWNYCGQRFWTFRYKNEQTI